MKDHPTLTTALGISSKSRVHHWNKIGGPEQIPGYSAHVKAVSRATKYMKAEGYLAIGIGGISSVLAIEQVCRNGSDVACEKIKFTEAGKFGMSTLLGGFGGWAAGAVASGPVCLGIGVATGGIGGIGGVVCVAAVVGAGAWAGTTVGGKVGEGIGEKIYQVTHP